MTNQGEQQSSKRLNLEKATNFMRQFRDPDSRELKKLSANQFMEVWSHYDKDGIGSLRIFFLLRKLFPRCVLFPTKKKTIRNNRIFACPN